MSLRERQVAAGAFSGAEDVLPRHYGDPVAEFEAGLHAVGMVDLSRRGRLELRGADRREYLHRITAQAVRDLTPPAGRRAALLERTGKIVDVFTVHALPEHLLLLTSTANRESTVAWLRRFVFRSDVVLADRTDTTGQLWLTGPAAGDVVRSLAGEQAAELESHGCVALPGLRSGLAIRGGPEGWMLVAPTEEMASLWNLALEAGGAAGLRPLGSDVGEALRILHGVPDGGAELDPRSNPLEVGLEDSVDLSKGCFTGQEALAKMITYSTVKRRLVGLELPGDPLPAAGEILEDGEARVGRVTSVARLPDGQGVGLALVTREQVSAGDRLALGDSGETAAVVDLPFPQTR